MNIIFRKVLVCSLFFVAHACFADAMNDFILKLEGIQSVSGHFEQTMKDAEGKDVADLTKGFFQLKRPGKFYWHTDAPYEQFVIGSESGLMIYDPDLEQVTIYEKDTWESSPAAVLSGASEAIKKKYTVEKQTEKNKETYVLAEINKDQKSFEKLSFSFEKSTLISMSLLDQMGQQTNIQFSKIKLNKKLDESLFAFSPPEDADVIINQ